MKTIQTTLAILLIAITNVFAQESNYEIKNLDINTEQSEFGATPYKNNTFIFAQPTVSRASDEPVFYNFFMANETPQICSNSKKVKTFSKELNSPFHESNAIFTKDFKTIYFTRTNYTKKRKRGRKDANGYVVLKLYKATNENGKWKDITELPFNSDHYSVGHPALSNDGKKLYFTSNMPGSYGESDIFVVDILGDNEYSSPRNLGPKINTKGKEMFPFVDENNNLYFSSTSHEGNNGGLDIYYAKSSNNNFESPKNLGFPINSDADDFSFIKKIGANSGYFSSNRYGGKGGDDIYSFSQNTTIITMNIDLD